MADKQAKKPVMMMREPEPELIDPVGPLYGQFDEEPDGAEVLVDYDNDREYIGTADYVVRAWHTGEEVVRVPADELRELSEAGFQRKINAALEQARSVKREFLKQYAEQQKAEQEA